MKTPDQAHELRFSLHYQPAEHRIAVTVWRDGRDSVLEYKTFNTRRGKHSAELLAKQYVSEILHRASLIKGGE